MPVSASYFYAHANGFPDSKAAGMRRYTLRDFDHQFPDDAACLAYLFKARWPRGYDCPHCERVTKHHALTVKRVYSCQECGDQVSPTAGTIFHKSSTSLRSWFYAIYLMAQTRTGIAAKQLERELGVTYKTAWRMFTQIRTLMGEDLHNLGGEIEADESYFGGKKSGGKKGRGAPGKTIAFGMVERQGRANVRIVPNVKTASLMPPLYRRVPQHQGHTIYTDELASYNLLTKLGYTHHSVNHSREEWARGSAHTNTIEGFWSMVKRGIGGVHHAVGPHYLQTYLDEYVFRYNRRKNETPMFISLLERVPALAVE